ncbi:amidohydrolase family protein [Mycobacterium sp. M1]|uniref:Amidohydrolase family protein n=1 Tax=Mycolicibacter acidiphilus TaxID=2835306 RepID=A0ABS5REC4_9MYCO|nr:amidohydrolase family protein [Mycolicibacter acidiphilus]MBS9532636.1 amidohydrolase family protein [Mycolicibacter acidiphilus]
MHIHRGNIVFTPTPQDFVTVEGGYLVVDGGTIVECVEELSDAHAGVPVTDHGDRLIIPGFTDAHVHASQLPITGLQCSTELIDWLHTLTFPQESGLHDPDYADAVYTQFVDALLRNGITGSVVMGTIHDTTGILVDKLAAAGLRGCVAKVSRDQNTPEDCRADTVQEIADSRRFIEDNLGKSPLVIPAIAPSVSMVCSRELMAGLAEQAAEFDIPCHMHLAENRTEVELTLKMYPDCADFVETYERAGLMKNANTVVAHAIHLTDREKQVIRDTGILIAHCPHSNLNLLSGVMKLAEYHDLGIRVGLGSDISAGHQLNMFSNIVAAIQSGAMNVLTERTSRPVLAAEAFYCATKGGGSFFGRTGSFEPGYAFDALIVDDSMWTRYKQMSLAQRIEKLIYCGDDRNVEHVYVEGRRLR